MKSKMGWMNMKTGSTEYLEGMPDDARLAEFLPQIPAAQNMYAELLEMGKTPQDAYMQVLDACCKPREDTNEQ